MAPISSTGDGMHLDFHSLRLFHRPVMVYIPPNGTLRGGAWVVVDSSINARYMEMYSGQSLNLAIILDDTGTGGVLESEGTLDIKFRKTDVLEIAHRLS